MHYNPGRRWKPRNRARVLTEQPCKECKALRASFLTLSFIAVERTMEQRVRYLSSLKVSRNSRPRSSASMSRFITTSTLSYKNIVFVGVTKHSLKYFFHLSQQNLAGFIEALKYMSRIKDLKVIFSYDKSIIIDYYYYNSIIIIRLLMVVIFPFIKNKTLLYVVQDMTYSI